MFEAQNSIFGGHYVTQKNINKDLDPVLPSQKVPGY
jgi:hypothetical protein